MIAYLAGTLHFEDPPILIIECGGVGYELRISLTSYELLRDQHQARVYTHWLQREEGPQLYGFAEPEEKRIFQQLIAVTGVGAGTALALLSSLKPQELQEAIARRDVALLKGIRGIGQKTAERLVLEMKDKVGQLSSSSGTHTPLLSTPREEALKALQNLGMPRQVMEKRLDELLRAQPALPVEQLIKLALRGDA